MIFSIVIPAKNEERNISRCFAALKNQNFDKSCYEIIVVDNGSTDRTVATVMNSGFSVYVKPELSLSGLRNFGASVSIGDILVFLDADCIPDSNWLHNAAVTLADMKIGCTGSTPVAPTDGTWVESVWSSFRTRRSSKCFTSWINSSNFIVRRELFNRVGGFNEQVKTCEDVDICMRLNKICKILFDPSVKVVHLGEPKTVKQFFFKEIWRGKGGISGLLSHGFSLSELKSFLLPIYYVCASVILVVSLLLLDMRLLPVFIFLYVLPALIFAAWIISWTKKVRYMAGYFILFLVYANARMIALFCR